MTANNFHVTRMTLGITTQFTTEFELQQVSSHLWNVMKFIPSFDCQPPPFSFAATIYLIIHYLKLLLLYLKVNLLTLKIAFILQECNIYHNLSTFVALPSTPSLVPFLSPSLLLSPYPSLLPSLYSSFPLFFPSSFPLSLSLPPFIPSLFPPVIPPFPTLFTSPFLFSPLFRPPSVLLSPVSSFPSISHFPFC